ncbi:hypothetical protein D5R40_21040 [Okeania hirsuta]|uniref:Uncharacterized protein n=1 Tax=Okeania hirsuta TaxID=1458930 RepID=A0A3N6P5P0_9CYAN|nr:hypothetical protein D5R40_21040 [Okeania hirsuta]
MTYNLVKLIKFDELKFFDFESNLIIWWESFQLSVISYQLSVISTSAIRRLQIWHKFFSLGRLDMTRIPRHLSTAFYPLKRGGFRQHFFGKIAQVLYN